MNQSLLTNSDCVAYGWDNILRIRKRPNSDTHRLLMRGFVITHYNNMAMCINFMCAKFNFTFYWECISLLRSLAVRRDATGSQKCKSLTPTNRTNQFDDAVSAAAGDDDIVIIIVIGYWYFCCCGRICFYFRDIIVGQFDLYMYIILV